MAKMPTLKMPKPKAEINASSAARRPVPAAKGKDIISITTRMRETPMKPVRMPSPNVDDMVKRPSSGPFSGKATPARMPTKENGMSASEATSFNKTFGTSFKAGDKLKAK